MKAKLMIDIHCHILPDVDDGPNTLVESLQVAQRCVADGLTHIVATPHCNRILPLMRDYILPRVEQLNEALQEAAIPIHILPGSEIQLYDVALYRQLYESGEYCHLSDDPEYSLLEFPWKESDAPDADATQQHILWLIERGTTPIIAHPERQPYLSHERVLRMVEAGAWIQISVDSLLGKNSGRALESAERLLREVEPVVLATDTHGLNRCSGLSPGFDWVREQFGVEREKELRELNARLLERLTQTQLT